MSKYDRLGGFLGTQANGMVALTLPQIEKIISGKLPASASAYRAWWGNEVHSGSRQCRAWMTSGWRVESVNLGTQIVVFRRI